MDNALKEKFNPNELSPQTLAFIGDGVYDLLVREYLVKDANRPVGVLNNMKVKLVNCKAQASFIKQLMPELTDKEISIYKRGRNAETQNTPKNSTVADYHSATGFEALFGYLYLSGELNRLKQLFNKILSFT